MVALWQHNDNSYTNAVVKSCETCAVAFIAPTLTNKSIKPPFSMQLQIYKTRFVHNSQCSGSIKFHRVSRSAALRRNVETDSLLYPKFPTTEWMWIEFSRSVNRRAARCREWRVRGYNRLVVTREARLAFIVWTFIVPFNSPFGQTCGD